MRVLSKTFVSGRTLSLLEFIPGVWLFCVPRGGRGRARYTEVGARRLLAARPRERRPTTRLKINRTTVPYCDRTETPTERIAEIHYPFATNSAIHQATGLSAATRNVLQSLIHGLRDFSCSTRIVPVKAGNSSAAGLVNSAVKRAELQYLVFARALCGNVMFFKLRFNTDKYLLSDTFTA